MNRSRLLMFFAGALPLALCSEARAAQPYIGGQVGYNFVLGNNSLDDDLSYGGTVGIDFAGLGASGLALEFTGNYAKYNAADCATLAGGNGFGNGGTELCKGIRDSFDVKADLEDWTLGLALRYNFDFNTGRFYLLGGGELNLTKYTVAANAIDQRNSSSDQIWGAEVGAGLEFKIGDHFTIGPDVRYHVLFTSKFNSIDNIENTDIADVPDFLSVQGRASIYF